jgi:radical SAM superfamily enzyme YgiQ (UPF0313 family)
MLARGWDELDVLIVTGDAYVDHPAFGPVLVARFLEGRGLRVGVVAQPRWTGIDDVARMGRPKLFVGISAGNLDSMLNKLTAQKKVRDKDQYSPAGRTGMRPNRASIVYANLCRQAFPGLPVVLGGIEASLRRIAHYDYWSDSVRRSILLDSKADLLVFGMGERAAWEVARRLKEGERIEQLTDIRGTAHVRKNRRAWTDVAEAPSRYVTDGKVLVLPSYEDVSKDKTAFAEMSRMFQYETNAHNARALLQPHGDEAVYFNPPALPLDEPEMDGLYDLPFVRRPHWSYESESIPAFETIRHSIVTMRGCFGGCTFCSITEHACRRLSCVHPGVCENLVTDHAPLIDLLGRVRSEPGVDHVYVASGIRYDLAARSPEFIRDLARYHTGGHLSVAPEHSNPDVLDKMKKPPVEHYERFAQAFCQASEDAGKEQYLTAYFITGHPGSTLADTIDLALWLKARNLRPRQVQDFIPTPMAIATAMYFTGIDPLTRKPVAVVRDLREKKMMKALLFWWDEPQQALAREALRKAGRTDLIGRGGSCLVPPAPRERHAAHHRRVH